MNCPTTITKYQFEKASPELQYHYQLIWLYESIELYNIAASDFTRGRMRTDIISRCEWLLIHPTTLP